MNFKILMQVACEMEDSTGTYIEIKNRELVTKISS
jgi:hypothetical protein